MKRKAKPSKPKSQSKFPDIRLTERLRGDLIRHVRSMIDEVMSQSELWDVIDEHVQTEYKKEGFAWLELDGPATVLCSIGSGDAVFRLPLDLRIDVDSAKAPQHENKRRLMYLMELMAELHEIKHQLEAAIAAARGAVEYYEPETPA